jgi:hypothetical protein
MDCASTGPRKYSSGAHGLGARSGCREQSVGESREISCLGTRIGE